MGTGAKQAYRFGILSMPDCSPSWTKIRLLPGPARKKRKKNESLRANAVRDIRRYAALLFHHYLRVESKELRTFVGPNPGWGPAS